MDAVCDFPDDWRVILCKDKNGKIIASFPFAYTKGKYGLWHIHNPWQAPRLGIWIDYGNKTRPSARESYENAIVEEIVSKLPPYDEFHIAFDARFQNWQQFYRMGFQQTSHYSYVMKRERDLEKEIPPDKRKELRKTQGFFVDETIQLDEYFSFFEQSYKKRERFLSYEKEKLYRLIKATGKNNCHHFLAIKNQDGKLTAVTCNFFDSRRVYRMFSTFDPEVPNGEVLLTLYSMRYAQMNGLDFDHEGSMIPGVADYNRDFGSIKEPYYVITNYSDKYRLLNGLRESAWVLKHMIRGK